MQTRYLLLSVILTGFLIVVLTTGFVNAGTQHDFSLSLSLQGFLSEDITLEDDVTLSKLVQVLGALTQIPLPPDSLLPIEPDWERGQWSSESSVEAGMWGEEIEPLAGSSLTIFTVPILNSDHNPHTLPDINMNDDLVDFMMMEEGVTVLEVIGIDGNDSQYPIVAFLCGDSPVMPNAERECQFVWDVPDTVE